MPLVNWLRSNTVSLLIALLLALTVWIIATQEHNPAVEFEMETPVAIDVFGLGSDLVITSDYPETARVTLRAQRNTIPSISSEDVVISADLSGLGPGAHQIPLNIDIASQAVLISANPSHIRLVIERQSTREYPIQLAIAGSLPTGYRFSEEEIVRTPERVSVTGPESLVDLVSEVGSAVSIEGLRESYSGVLQLVPRDSDGNMVSGVTLLPGTVEITIPIVQEAGFREVAIRVPTVGRPASGYYMTSRIVTPPFVTLQGNQEIIETLPPLISTEPIDLSGLSDDLIIEVGLDLPSGVVVVGPPTVQVLITVAAQQDSRSLIVQAVPVGLDEGLQAVLNPTDIEVFISGPLPVLQALNANEDIVVNVDLFGLGPGTYQIEPEVQIANTAISIDSVLPVVIDVEITEITEEETP